MTLVTEQTDTTSLAFEAIQAATAIFVAADTKDWAGLRSRLAERVRLDWTSLNGGDPAELSGDEVTEGWRTLLSGFDATHHQLGNFLIDEIDAEHARLRFYGTATHVMTIPGQEARWVLGGNYQAVLRLPRGRVAHPRADAHRRLGRGQPEPARARHRSLQCERTTKTRELGAPSEQIFLRPMFTVLMSSQTAYFGNPIAITPATSARATPNPQKRNSRIAAIGSGR